MPTFTPKKLPLLLRRAALLLPLLCLSLLAQAQTRVTSFASGSLSFQTVETSSQLVTPVKFKVQEIYSILNEFRVPFTLGEVVATKATIDFGDGTPPEQVKLTVVRHSTSDYFVGEYNTTHTYTEPGRYFVIVRGEARLTGGNFVAATLVGVGAGATNDSPVSAPAPNVVLTRNQRTVTYQVPASDPNGDALTYSLATPQETGTTNPRVNPSGLSIDPRTGLLSFDTTDKPADLYSAVVKIADGTTLIFVDQLFYLGEVVVPNVAPELTDPTPRFGQEFRVVVGQTVTFTVRAIDRDAGDVVRLEAFGLPAGAVLTPASPVSGNPVQATFTWTPTVAQIGRYYFGFAAYDRQGLGTGIPISMQVISRSICDPVPTAPVANADQLRTAAGRALTFASGQLLANDTDPLGRPLQVGSIGPPSRGTLVTNADGTFTYTPAPGFVGTVSFPYQVRLAGPVLASTATGHYYEFVSAPGIGWYEARAAAAARTYQGQTGYLATITSAAEKDALTGRFPGQYWFGASDEEVEGEWRWKTGPEAGQLFWRGAANGTALGYANWVANQPDDYKNQFRSAGEDYAHFYGQSGLWNDLDVYGTGSRLAGYLVEYGGLGDCTPVLYATGTVTILVGPASAQSRELVANSGISATQFGLEALPNPSSGQFRLRVTAAQEGPVQVELYDLQGRRVKSVFAGSLSAGEVRELPVEAPLATGIYLVRLQSGRQVQHLRVAVQK